MRAKRFEGAALPAAAILCAAIFVLDLLAPLGVAVWLLYFAPVVLAFYSPKTWAPVAVTAGCTALIAAGYIFSPPGSIAASQAAFNRALDLGLLWAIAFLLAQRKRTETASARNHRQLAVFSEVVTATASTLDLATILNRTLRGALDLTGLEGGTLCLLKPGSDSLELATSINASPETIKDLTENAIRVGDCLCGHCAQTCRPLVLWDNASASEFATREATRQEGIRFHAAFPLFVPDRREKAASNGEPSGALPPAATALAGTRCMGVLCVFSRDDRKPVEHGLTLLQDLCAPVALAIENARLSQSEHAARAQVEASREQLSRVFERVTDAFVALDRDWRFTYVNVRAGEIFGRKPEALIGRDIWTEFPEGLNQPFRRAYEQALAEQRPVVFEDFYAPFQRWFESIIYPSPDGLSIYFHDITERKLAEEATHQEFMFSEAVLNSLPGVFYCYDDHLRFLRWNRNFEVVTGYTGPELSHISPLELFNGPERDLVAARIQEVFERGSSDVEADFVSKSGARRRYYFTGLRVSIAGRRCLVGVGIDIAERKEAENALRESEERLRLALEAAHMGMFDWDVPGNRIRWSRRHEELWGFAPGEFAGTYEAFSQRVHPDDLPGVNAEVARCIAAREPFEREFRVMWPDGTVHWIMGLGEFKFGADHPVERMRGVVLETTARHHAEEQVLESREQLRALLARFQRLREEERTRMAREVHDVLGQLLTGLKMDLSWWERRLPKISDEALRRELETKAQGTSTLADAMIETVQKIARELRPSVLDNLGLGAVLQFEGRQFQERTGIVCEVSVPDDTDGLDPDVATGVFRIFQELLTNVARHAKASRVQVSLREAREDFTLEVTDNGRGIRPEELTAAGSLGLLGMRERASLMDGRMEIAGTPGGTTARLTISRRSNKRL